MRQLKKSQIEQLFSERLKFARKRLGLTQHKLAKATGISLSAVGNWESCLNVPGPAKLNILAKKLGVTIDYLLGHSNNSGLNLKKSAASAIKIRQVPIVSWAQAGELKAYTDLDDSWHEFTTTTCRDEDSFAVTIAGDSMEPKYNSGDIAIVMPNVEPRNGCPGGLQARERGRFLQALSPVRRRQGLPPDQLQHRLPGHALPQGRLRVDLPRLSGHQERLEVRTTAARRFNSTAAFFGNPREARHSDNAKGVEEISPG